MFGVVFVVVDIDTLEVLNRVNWKSYETGEHPAENRGNLPITALAYSMQPPELDTHHLIQDENHVVKKAKALSIVKASALFFVKTVLTVRLPEPIKFLNEPQS